MNDYLFWSLVFLGLVVIGFLVWRFFIYPRQVVMNSAKLKSQPNDALVDELLRGQGINPKGVNLTIEEERDSDGVSSDARQTAEAERALSEIRNGKLSN